MGMYDCINGIQIKCFGIPCYYGKNENEKYPVNEMGGLLRNYNIGSKVPIKTFWYKYNKNLIILDIYDTEYSIICHIIENGIIKNTLFNNEIKNIKNIEKYQIIDYYGKNLNIKNISDIYNYKKNMKIYRNKIYDSSKETKTIINQIKNNKNDNNHKHYLKQLQEIENKQKIQRKNLYKELLKKYEDNNDENKEEYIFGMLYECLRKNKNKEEIKDYTKEFIENNENIIEKYCLWMNFKKERIEKSIEILLKK